jgi:hypothetical protein
MDMNSKTLACVQSKTEGFIFLMLIDDHRKLSFDIFEHCEQLADQHEGASWFVGDASMYEVTVKPNYDYD